MSRRCQAFYENNRGRHAQMGHSVTHSAPQSMPGSSYNPADTIVCPIDGKPTARLPDGTYVCDDGHVTVRTPDGGFAPAGSTTVQFGREDCAIFNRYPKPVHWDEENVSPA